MGARIDRRVRMWLATTSLSVALVGCGQPAAPVTQPDQATASAAPANQVRLTNHGFEPPTLTVAKGTTVTWQNDDGVPHWVAVDPYPIHTGYAGFVSDGPLAPGATFSFTFQRVGDWPYADHLRPVSYTGMIKVTD